MTDPRPTGTRCTADCHAPRSSQAHCPVCHCTTSGTTYFDAHRRDGRCLDLAELGLVEINGLWSTPEGHEHRTVLADRMTARLQVR